MPLEDYPPAELEPRKLTKEQIVNPIEVLHNFFDFVHLPEAREHLWELLKTTVTGNYCKTLTRGERSNLIYFYEQLEKLLEASHLIHANSTKTGKTGFDKMAFFRESMDSSKGQLTDLLVKLEEGDKTELVNKGRELINEYIDLTTLTWESNPPSDLEDRKNQLFRKTKDLFIEAIKSMKIPDNF